MKEDEKVQVPQSDPVDEPVNARAYDADGNVRPADGRWLGDRNDDVPKEQLQAEREQQVAEAEQREYERMRKQNNSELADVDEHQVDEGEPTIPPPPDPDPEHPYAGLTYPELQQAAKARDLSAGGSADEIRARLTAADADNQ